jgi:hypothetical protein
MAATTSSAAACSLFTVRGGVILRAAALPRSAGNTVLPETSERLNASATGTR